MLGIGLHSYGFMGAAFVALIAFIATQLVLIGIAYLGCKAECVHRAPVVPQPLIQ